MQLKQTILPYVCRQIYKAASLKKIRPQHLIFMPKFILFLAQGVRCYDTVDSRHKIRLTANLREIMIRLTARSEVHSCYYDSLLQRLKNYLFRPLTHKVHGVDKIMLQLVFVGMCVSVYSNSFPKHWHSYIHIYTDQAIHLSAWHAHECLHTLHIHLLTRHLILHNQLIYPHTMHVHISTYNYTPGI